MVLVGIKCSPRRPTALNIRGASVPPSHDRLWVPDGQTAVVCVPYDGLYFLDCCGLNRKIGPTSDRALNTGCFGAALRSRLMDAVRHNAPK
jgi:hypothetical protein